MNNLIFKGISKEFSLLNNDQYNSIGDFWDEMASLYGLENLQGLGYKWIGNTIHYAIGLKVGVIKDYNVCIELPSIGWNIVVGETDNLKEIYDEIYRDGPLRYELETFYKNGKCQIKYYR
jgi:predicted transcriptional regulator YdeE